MKRGSALALSDPFPSREHLEVSIIKNRKGRCTFLGYPAVPCIDLRAAYHAKISRRIKKLFKISIDEHPISGHPINILAGTSVLDRAGEEYFSFAVPFDSLSASTNALIFLGALYSPKDVLDLIIERASRACNVEQRTAPIIPHQHDKMWKIDVYTEFLRKFQRGVPAVSLISLARTLISASAHSASVSQAWIGKHKALKVASQFIKVVDSIHDESGSLTVVISAEEFALKCVSCGCTREETLSLSAAAVGIKLQPSIPLEGFPLYVNAYLVGQRARK